METRKGNKLCWQRQLPDAFTLDDRAPVLGAGPDTDVRMAFMGSAPDAQDVEQGQPFVSKAGRYLHHYLSEVGIYSAGCYFTNVIDRRPDDDNMKTKPAREAIAVQKNEAWAELSWLASHGLKVVVALGETAKEFFGIKEPLTKCRGSIYEITLNWQGLVTDPTAEPCDFVVIPTYAPEFIMRGKGFQRKNENMRSDMKLAWLEDFKSAHDIATKGYKRPVERFITSPTFDQVAAYCQERIEAGSEVAIDIETSGFNPTSDKVVCIGMAHTEEDGLCVPFYKTGPDVTPRARYWTPGEAEQVKLWLERLFASCPLILQNAVFDVGYLQQAGWKISADHVAHDTMLLHHSIAAELPHNLGYITSIYGATPYWKGEFLTRDTTIWEMNFKDLQVYNLRDCIVLHQILKPMLADLDELGTQAAYAESLNLIGPIIEMQQTGVLISKGKWNKWKKRLRERVDELKALMIELGGLPPNFTFAPAEVTLFLYSIQADKHTKAAEWEKHKPGSAVRASKKELHEMVQAIKPLWNNNYRGHFTDTGSPSLDRNGITGLRIHASNRLQALINLKKPTTAHYEEQAALQKFTKWLDYYAEWKRVEKMDGMFRDLPIRQDGRLHPSLLIHGTNTGRLSCLAENTLVTTKQGLQFICDIEDGTLVLTHKGNWRAATKIDQGTGQVVRFTLSSGRFIECTADHRVLTPRGWTAVSLIEAGEEVVCGYSKKISRGTRELEPGSRAIPCIRQANSSSAIRRVQDDTSHDQPHSTRTSIGRADQSRAEVEILPIEDGTRQPYVRQNGTTTSQLEGRLRRPERVFNQKAERGALVQTSNSHGRRFGYSSGELTQEHGRASHRRRQFKQQPRQLSSCDKGGTWCFAHETVVEATPVGTVHIWDLAVDKDHSFVANGVVVHNCSKPNIQQWNKDEGADDGIREIIVAPAGHYIVAADYSNLEFRVMAYECHDKKMLQIIEQGLNQHDENTRAMFDIDESHPKWKTYRQAAKTYQFASQYGAGDKKIHETLTIRVPEANFTMSDIKRMRANFEKTYAGWATWCTEVQTKAARTRISENAFGRKRILYGNDHEIKNQALNTPVQSGAAHIINEATYRIWKRIAAERLRTRLQIQIHDELRFEVPADELDYVCKMVKEEMEKPVDYRGQQVTFPVNVEYGKDWHHLQECI